jgi:hypothetical protein
LQDEFGKSFGSPNSVTVEFEGSMTEKKASSQEASETLDKKEIKEEGKMVSTPTKKKPIKMPSTKKQFVFNEDSDS